MNTIPCQENPLDPGPVLGIVVTARLWKVLATIALVLPVIACDPGFRYQPVGWERSGGGTWEYENEDLHFVMLPPGGLIGSTWLAPEPEIENRTAETIVITAVTLVSRGVTYQSKVAGEGRTDRGILAPGEKKRVAFVFDLGEPTFKALAEDIVFTVNYRIGEDRMKEIVTRLKKTQ